MTELCETRCFGKREVNARGIMYRGKTQGDLEVNTGNTGNSGAQTQSEKKIPKIDRAHHPPTDCHSRRRDRANLEEAKSQRIQRMLENASHHRQYKLFEASL